MHTPLCWLQPGGQIVATAKPVAGRHGLALRGEFYWAGPMPLHAERAIDKGGGSMIPSTLTSADHPLEQIADKGRSSTD